MKRRQWYTSAPALLKALDKSLQPNDPTRRGAYASDYCIFGPHGRYAVFAAHTRFNAVTYFVMDIEQIDAATGDPGRTIRQEDSAQEAIAGLALT